MEQPPPPPPIYETQPQPAGYNPQPVQVQPAYGAQPYGAQPYGGQPVGAQPYGGQPVGAQPYGGQPVGAQPYGGQPIGAGYPGAYPAAGQTLVLTGVTFGPGFTRDPMQMKCTQCGADVLTEVKYVIGQGTYCCMLILILMGCWLGCCLFPFFSNSFKDAEHHCPNCKAHLGTCQAQRGGRVGVGRGRGGRRGRRR